MDTWKSYHALAAVLVLTAGCTAAPSPETGPAPVMAKPAVAEPLAERFCAAVHTLPVERRKACCNTSAASLAPLCVEHLSRALRQGTVTLDAAAVGRCAADTESALAGCGWVTPLLPKPPPSCAGVLQGTLAPGGACASSLECADGLYCRGLSLDGAGLCAAPAAPRARCETPADSLAGFTASRDDPRHRECEGQCVRGRCLPFAGAGEPCAARSSCRPGLNCLAGRCEDRPLPALGEPCTGTGCGAGFCQDGVCTAFKERGAPCRLPFECRGLVCEKTAGSPEGVCGDPCGTAAVTEPAARR